MILYVRLIHVHVLAHNLFLMDHIEKGMRVHEVFIVQY